MTRPSVTIAAGLIILASGCGRTLPIPRADAPEPTDASNPPSPEPATPYACPFLNPESDEAVALVASDGSEVHFVDARVGTARFIPSEKLRDSATQIIVTGVQVVGPFVAVASIAYVGKTSTSEIGLLATDGSLKWRREVPSAWAPAFLSPSGTVAVGAQSGPVITADGAVIELGSVTPVEAVSDNGWVPALRPLASESRFLWRQVATAAERPFAVPVTAADLTMGGYPRWIGERLSYVLRRGDRAMIVLETTRGQTTTVTLPPGSDQGGRGVVDVEGARWVLIGDAGLGPNEAWRLDLEDDAAANVRITQPEGWSISPGGMLSLGGGGALFAQFGNPASGTAAFRSADLGRTWTRVGDVIAPGDEGFVSRSLRVDSAGGTLALSTEDSVGFAQVLSSAQIVRDGVVRHVAPITGSAFFPAAPIALTADGLCAAWWTDESADGIELRVMDVATGTTKTVVQSASGPSAFTSSATSVAFAPSP